LLCELLEVPDERWQDAVEAMLDARRFTIIERQDTDDISFSSSALSFRGLYQSWLIGFSPD
jgi:hypothetical protein